MKTLDFSKMQCEFDFAKGVVTQDLSEEIANYINSKTYDLGLVEVARKVYFTHGPVEVEDRFIPEIDKLLKEYLTPPAYRGMRTQYA